MQLARRTQTSLTLQTSTNMRFRADFGREVDEGGPGGLVFSSGPSVQR